MRLASTFHTTISYFILIIFLIYEFYSVGVGLGEGARYPVRQIMNPPQISKKQHTRVELLTLTADISNFLRHLWYFRLHLLEFRIVYNSKLRLKSMKTYGILGPDRKRKVLL